MSWKKPTPTPGQVQVWARPWQQDVSVPPELNPSVFAQEKLGSPEEIWLKAFGRLFQLCSAKADSFFPWEGPSPSASDAQEGSKLLPCTPQLRAHQWGLLLSPGEVASSWPWHCCQVPPAGRAGWGSLGRAGACAEEGGELTGLIFSRLRWALTCDPRYRKDAANASSPGAAWLDLVGRGKSTARLFRPAGVASNSNLISP